MLEMRDGLNAKVGKERGSLPRPVLAGEKYANVPLRIKRYGG